MGAPTEQLARLTVASGLSQPLEGNRVRCLACGHRCPIPAGFSGVCKVRFNRGGELRAPFGYVNALQADPIEKKPFFHALPGGVALSFGMLGCNLHCGYCQNWRSSQALRDFRSPLNVREIQPAGIVEAARRCGASAIVSTYNEPLITAEWASAVFSAAHEAGLATGFVSNGNATAEVLDYLRPVLDLYKVDLKSFSKARYRELGGRLEPVLDSIQRVHQLGLWLEVVTLVVPGFNDSENELRAIAHFLASVSPEIPWHVTAFHKDYKMTAPGNTPAAMLERAVALGRAEGLHYVYAGNLEGRAEGLEDTRCPACGTVVIERRGYRVVHNRAAWDGICPGCGTKLAGYWHIAARAAREPQGSISLHCG
jgi:pyruvate formate lyase activating enzyme